MADRQDNSVTDGLDPLVSAEYCRLADESAPERLNHAVLKAARKAAGRNMTALWQVPWFRPVTTVAVIALSLAFILEIGDVDNPGSIIPDGDPSMPVDIPPDVFRNAADKAAVQIRDAEAAARRRSQNSGLDNAAATDTVSTVDQATLMPADQGCDTEQKSTMATWWKCIESLESHGAKALAEQEMSALLQTFPAFVEP